MILPLLLALVTIDSPWQDIEFTPGWTTTFDGRQAPDRFQPIDASGKPFTDCMGRTVITNLIDFHAACYSSLDAETHAMTLAAVRGFKAVRGRPLKQAGLKGWSFELSNDAFKGRARALTVPNKGSIVLMAAWPKTHTPDQQGYARRLLDGLRAGGAAKILSRSFLDRN